MATKEGMGRIRKAFVMGAGLGTRLRPLTDLCPKPLIPIFNKPLITFALDHLIANEVEGFIVNTHHCPEAFERLFGAGEYHGHPVELANEPVLLETGGGIKNVEQSLGKETFLVYSGDILTDVALAPLIEEHFARGNDVTLALRATGLAAGVVCRDGRVTEIRGADEAPGDYDFANISIWNAGIFSRIASGEKISFIPILKQWIKEGGRVGGVVLNEGQWWNIGTRDAYLEIHRWISRENWKPTFVPEKEWPVRVHPLAQIAESATIRGFASIGPRCVIGNDATIEESILWEDAQIASRSALHRCIVRAHQKVEGRCQNVDI